MYLNVHLRVVKMVNFTVCMFCHDLKNRNIKPLTSTNSPFTPRPQSSKGVQRKLCPSWGREQTGLHLLLETEVHGPEKGRIWDCGPNREGAGVPLRSTLWRWQNSLTGLQREKWWKKKAPGLSFQARSSPYWPSRLSATMPTSWQPKPQPPSPLLPISCPQFNQTPNL